MISTRSSEIGTETNSCNAIFSEWYLKPYIYTRYLDISALVFFAGANFTWAGWHGKCVVSTSKSKTGKSLKRNAIVKVHRKQVIPSETGNSSRHSADFPVISSLNSHLIPLLCRFINGSLIVLLQLARPFYRYTIQGTDLFSTSL